MCCARCHIGHKYGDEHSGSDVFGTHELAGLPTANKEEEEEEEEIPHKGRVPRWQMRLNVQSTY